MTGAVTAIINNQDPAVGFATGASVGGLGGLTLGTSLVATAVIGGSSALAGNVMNQAIASYQNKIGFVKNFDISSAAISTFAGTVGGLVYGIFLPYEGAVMSTISSGSASGAAEIILNLLLNLYQQINDPGSCPAN